MSTSASPDLHHLTFGCRDLAAATHFYEDVMGFPLGHADGNLTAMSS
jgi:catechol 2,3-dioxygenase-like lactoylglutathione lyase family enzyme